MIKPKLKFILIFILPAVLLYILIYLVPTIIIFITGFTKWDGANTIRFVGLENYRRILFEDTAFRSALINTLLWGACAAFIHVPFGVLMALILNRKPLGWEFVRSASLLPEVISNSAKAIIYIFIFNPGIGLLNGFIRLFGDKDFSVNWFYDEKTAFLAVTLTWVFYVGVIILITLGELLTLPASFRESAKIDGATDFQIDWYINLPLIKNIIGTGVIVSVITVFKYFEQIYLTTAGGPGNSTTNIALLVYQNITNSFQYGYANALGTILLMLGIVVIVVVSKVFSMGKSSYE